MKKSKRVNGFLQISVLIAAIICLFIVTRNNNQATLSLPMPQKFVGEYSQNGGKWKPLKDKTKISAFEGDVILRGHLKFEVPQEGGLVFYADHIGYSFYINGELFTLNAVMEQELNSAVCGRNWCFLESPGITPSDEIEIHLKNPHTFGNKNAFQYFLKTLCNTPVSTEIVKKYLKPYCLPFKISGCALLVLSLLLLGASAASLVLKVPIGTKLEKAGLLTFFAGGYFLLDTLDCFYTNGLVVLQTYGHQMCMMFFALWFGFCLLEILDGKEKKAAGIGVLVSAAFDVIFLVLSFCKVTVLYDTLFYWTVLQAFLCILYLVTCICAFRHTSRCRRILLISGMLLCVSMILDLAGVGKTMYSQGTCTKAVFVVLTVWGILWAVKSIITDHQASIRILTLEKELEESRISIMLSQIQPHFLYNALNTIYHLCEKDAAVAQQAISDFSDYLQMNLKSLDQKCPVPFLKELKHVKNYLNLEKLRFDDELNVRYEIQTADFALPALSVQPLVENAVKHGICPKEGGGTVVIRSGETEQYYTVTVIDDGVGFDTKHPEDDGKSHIGIENVRRRLQAMCHATLLIDSTPGRGTTAVIRIPKEESNHADHCSR